MMTLIHDRSCTPAALLSSKWTVLPLPVSIHLMSISPVRGDSHLHWITLCQILRNLDFWLLHIHFDMHSGHGFYSQNRQNTHWRFLSCSPVRKDGQLPWFTVCQQILFLDFWPLDVHFDIHVCGDPRCTFGLNHNCADVIYQNCRPRNFVAWLEMFQKIGRSVLQLSNLQEWRPQWNAHNMNSRVFDTIQNGVSTICQIMLSVTFCYIGIYHCKISTCIYIKSAESYDRKELQTVRRCCCSCITIML